MSARWSRKPDGDLKRLHRLTNAATPPLSYWEYLALTAQARSPRERGIRPAVTDRGFPRGPQPAEGVQEVFSSEWPRRCAREPKAGPRVDAALRRVDLPPEDARPHVFWWHGRSDANAPLRFWWHGRSDANAPLRAVERFTALTPSVELRLWDGGHVGAYRHEEEILANLLGR